MQPEIIWRCTRSTYFSLVINNMNNNLALWPIFWDNAGKSVLSTTDNKKKSVTSDCYINSVATVKHCIFSFKMQSSNLYQLHSSTLSPTWLEA